MHFEPFAHCARDFEAGLVSLALMVGVLSGWGVERIRQHTHVAIMINRRPNPVMFVSDRQDAYSSKVQT